MIEHAQLEQINDTMPWYRREPWLALCLASLVPVIAAVFAPPAWKLPLAGVTVLLMVISVVMLTQQLRRATRG